MKKALFLKPMLLLFALIVGCVSAWADGTYEKITSTNDLKIGGHYLIVYETSSSSGYVMGASSGNYMSGIQTTISSNRLTAPNNANVITLGSSSSGDYTLQLSSNNQYLYGTTSTNLGTSDDINSSNIRWTISFDDSGNAKIFNVVATTRSVRCYSSNHTFRHYAGSTGADVQLYKEVTSSGPVEPIVSINVTKIAVGGNATISYPSDLEIEFSSNNTSVATVDEGGIVTGVSAGEAKITATWDELADTYNSGSKEFTVKVVGATVYNKVTQFSQLVAGNKYILVAIDNNKAMGAIENNNTYRSPVDVTVSNNQVTIVDEAVAELTLGIGTEAWTFLAGDNQEYLALNSASKALHSTATKNDNTNWTVTTDFQLESSNHSGWILQYNAGSPRFACYSSTQKQAVLFVKAGSPEVNPVSITPNKAITTYVTPNNLNFSSVQGLEAYVATAASGGVVTLVKVSGNVPVGTPLLLKGTASTPYSVSVASSATAPATNLLQAGDGETTIGGANVYDYILKNGLWYRANEGILAADKAYLHCDSDPTVGGAPELSMDWGEDTTGIMNINRGTITDNQYYTLDGRCVAEPTKGIYIINGKKVVVK